MEWKWVLGVLGWALAAAQFIFNSIRTKARDENALLEKTLGYFERGAISRSIGISLVEGIWLKQNKNLSIIAPILVGQLVHLMFEVKSDDYGIETKNTVRILYLLEACVKQADDPASETADISDALMRKVDHKGGVVMSKLQLRHWFAKFNSGDTEQFDIETKDS